MVAHYLGVVGAAGSNPVTQIDRKWWYYEVIRKSPFLFWFYFCTFWASFGHYWNNLVYARLLLCSVDLCLGYWLKSQMYVLPLHQHHAEHGHSTRSVKSSNGLYGFWNFIKRYVLFLLPHVVYCKIARYLKYVGTRIFERVGRWYKQLDENFLKYIFRYSSIPCNAVDNCKYRCSQVVVKFFKCYFIAVAYGVKFVCQFIVVHCKISAR